MPLTTISMRFCHRDNPTSDESLRVASHDTSTNTPMTTQVNTMVAFKEIGPHCQIAT